MERTTKTLTDVKNDPLFKLLCKSLGISDKDLEEYEAQENSVNEHEDAEPEVAEEPDEEVNKFPEEDEFPKECECDGAEKTLCKDDVKAVLEQWKDFENDIYKLDSEYGINIWDTASENSIYSKLNLLIRNLLVITFGEDATDILEDWTFGYTDEDRPSFDSVWEHIIKN